MKHSAQKIEPQKNVVKAESPPPESPSTCERVPKAQPMVMRVRATAYSSTPDQTDGSPCITSTGFDVCKNCALYGAVNAVASNKLPIHTTLKIPELYGDKIFVIRDRMNARYNAGEIDLWMPTRWEAQQFGTKYLNIHILQQEP